MLPIMKDETVNSKLFQFKLALKKHLTYNRNNIKWIFQRVGNLDDQVQTTKYLESHHPEWIGYTALHFVAHLRNADAYKILVDRGTDITLKNNDGSTALHIAIEKNPEDKIVPDLFVHSILSAHLKQNNFLNPCNKNGLSHFHIACLADNVELVKQFLDHGVSVIHSVKMESTSFSGFTPLHFSVEYRCIEVTKVLLSHGASMQIKDARGLTPLHILLRENLEFADPAIAEKCGVDMFSEVAIDREMTELAKRLGVVHPGKKETLATILELFHIHYRTGNMIIDDTGLSQLHVSCVLRDKEETECLLEKALDINHRINMNSPVWPGYTALHFAAHSDIDIVKLLLKNGANIQAKDAKGLTPFDICLRKYKVSDIHSLMLATPSWKNIVLSDGKRRLTDVVFAMRDADCFKKFLRKLAKNLHVHVPNNSPLWPGFSMMHLAVVLSKREALNIDQWMQQILQELFDRAPDLLQHQEAHGWTPLHLAYRLRKDEVINALIPYHQTLATPSDCVDEDGLSHVHIASAMNSGDFLEKLLLNGSNVNAVYRGTLFSWRGIYPGSTPLHFAVNYKNEKTVKTLLKYQANVYVKDKNDMTPVHLLVATIHEPHGHERHLLNLLDLKDSVVNGVGLSHLHVACLYRCWRSMSILISNGANVLQRLITEPITHEVLKCLNEWRGCTPLKMAFKKECEDSVDVILLQNPGFAGEYDEVLYEILWNRDVPFMYPSRQWIDEQLLTRLREDTGMTALHLFCWLDFQEPEELARLAVDANVQIREDSPIWPGWTPVHVLSSRLGLYSEEGAFDLLLKAGVNVLLTNVDGDTVVHMAYKCYRNPENGFKLHSLVNKLLQAQKDFSVNPANIEGLSHFHVACAMSNVPIVEKFLQNSFIDVNRPIDFFNETLGGQTPLHLVASGKNTNTDVTMQMQTVELLLKYGADVHAENNRGNTALHECFDSYWKSVDVFERIAKQGVDVNARNILGHTPLKYFLSKGRISVEEIIRLLRLGCDLNTFNPVTEEGCFGEALSSIPVEEIESFVSTLKNDFARLLEVDVEGRTIIHNFASIFTVDEICLDKWVSWIEHLSNLGNDIDNRDSKGRTPLHMAVKLQSVQAISALLMAGADVNLVDVEDITAFNHCWRGCEQCEEIFDNREGDLDYYEFDDNDDDEDDSAPCRHIQIFKIMAIHVRKMLHCGLDVSEDNLDDSEEARWMFKDVNERSEEFLEELEQIKEIIIEPCSIPLSDLLSENGVVVDFPTMSLAKRASINEFFSPSKMSSFRKKFRETAGIVQLQYRKAVIRVDLVEKAKDSLTILARFRLDDICLEMIFKKLKNSELILLIASTKNEA